jgi:flagellar protein FlaG
MIVTETTQVLQNASTEKQKMQPEKPRKTEDTSLQKKEPVPANAKEGIGPAEKSQDGIKVNKVSIEKTVQSLQKYLDAVGRELNFEINDQNDNIVIKVLRKSDGKVIRQIPSEAMQKLAQRDLTNEDISGLLFEESA